MRYRLYFVLPDVQSARQVEDDLLLAKVEDRRMHFLAKRGTDLNGLPEASIFQKTDLLHGMEVGLVVGAAAGAAIGLGLIFYPVIGTAMGIAKVFFGALIGAVFGIWAAGMIGIGAPNIVLKQFERTLQEGHILMMVDVPQHQVETIRKLVLARHPEAEDHGTEPTVPAFP
jgi:hypothetical protein